MGDIESQFQISFEDYFKDAMLKIKKYEEDNLVQMIQKKIIVTDQGKLLIRNVAMCFDGFIEKQIDHTMYSKTV